MERDLQMLCADDLIDSLGDAFQFIAGFSVKGKREVFLKASHREDYMGRREISNNALETPNFLTKLRDFVDRLLGCWHGDLSRPFTVEGETYRVCLYCGARRPFVAESWMNTGTFYREAIPHPVQEEKPVAVVAEVQTELNEAAPYHVAA